MKKPYMVSILVALLPFCFAKAKSFESAVFLGDHAVYQCQNNLSCHSNNHKNILTPSKNATATDRANLAYVAKQGILVVDATIGPTATIREDLLIARQTKLPKLSIWFINTEQLFQALGKQEGQALLDLEVEEIKNLLDFYVVEEMATEFYFGKNGLKELMADSNALPIPSKDQQLIKAKTLKTYVYNLTQLEQQYSKPLTNNMVVTVWIAGKVSQAKLVLDKDIEMGDHAELQLYFNNPIQSKVGERFFIQINHHLVALGLVAEILE